jgi:cytochrome b subunit of formate dehydrogenase
MIVNVSSCLPSLAVRNSEARQLPRHSTVVRMTHWIHAISFIALAVSGICVLLAHPRIYLGETGTVAESYEWLTGASDL